MRLLAFVGIIFYRRLLFYTYNIPYEIILLCIRIYVLQKNKIENRTTIGLRWSISSAMYYVYHILVSKKGNDIQKMPEIPDERAYRNIIIAYILYGNVKYGCIILYYKFKICN